MRKETTPVFTTAFSLKSILTVKSNNDPAAADSVVDIAKELNLEKVVILEENMACFMQLFKAFKEKLVYGLRFTYFHDEALSKSSKICIFALNSDGYGDLMRLFSKSRTSNIHDGLTETQLREGLTNNLQIVIPFYNSFLHINKTSYDGLTFPMDLKPQFFVSENGLLLDPFLREAVEKFCKAGKFEMFEMKNIYYKKKSDFNAYTTHRVITSRSGYSSSPPSLGNPNIRGLASNRFCVEAWLEDCSR